MATVPVESSNNQKDQKKLQAIKMGLSLLGSLQEQGRNRQPNINNSFSVSSPKFSFSAQRRAPETDALQATIQGLEDIRKQREKVFKEQEALDTVLQKNELGKTLASQGLQGQLELGSEGTQATFGTAKKPFADQLAQALGQQFGLGTGAQDASSQGLSQALGQTQSTSDPVTAQTHGAVQIPGSNPPQFGIPQGKRGLAREKLSGGGVSVVDLDTKAAIQEIQNLSPEKASDTEKKDLANLVNSIESMDGLAQLINTNKEQFEEQLGPLKLSNFQGGLGELARKVKGDPILSTLALETETTFQQVRSAITGAQASAKELEILRPLTPQLTDPINIFIAKTMAFRRVAHRSLSNKLNVLKATGVDTGALEDFNRETLAITESEYRIQLIENGVSPEKADKLVASFSKDAGNIIKGSDALTNLVNQKGAKFI